MWCLQTTAKLFYNFNNYCFIPLYSIVIQWASLNQNMWRFPGDFLLLL